MQGTGTHPGLQQLVSHCKIGVSVPSRRRCRNPGFTIPAESATPASGSRASAMATASSRCPAVWTSAKATNPHLRDTAPHRSPDGRSRGMMTEPSTRAAGLPIYGMARLEGPGTEERILVPSATLTSALQLSAGPHEVSRWLRHGLGSPFSVCARD